MPKHRPQKKPLFPLVLVKQMATLSTGAFSLVAALSWNEVIKTLIDSYIKPYFGKDSGILASIIYAFVVTAIAVFVTIQLSALQEKLEKRN